MTDKLDSLKVNIKTQPGEMNIKTIVVYVLRFQTGIPESLLKFVTLLHKIIQDKDLPTRTKKFGMTGNLVVREALRVAEHKNLDRGTKTNVK